MKNYFQQYCTGCGLCQNLGYTKLEYMKDGFTYPDHTTREMNNFCEKVCPIGKRSINSEIKKYPWGDYFDYYVGYSCNKDIRLKASSGGILTEICTTLLQTGKVDAIIQTKYDKDNPLETVTVVSNTIEDIINCAGSRYAISSPLIQIDNIIDSTKKYAFVGKPCDVVALKNYSNINNNIKTSIAYYLSFFCAGTPSKIANEQMLEALHCNPKDCKHFVYRGNGWPGKVTATDSQGESHSMDYNTAWMSILGRIIRKSCKFCVDSIGEAADISCGDYWHLDANNNPSFEEADGVNCIFTWTEKGSELLQYMHTQSIISIQKENIDKLKYVQPNHFNRRCTIFYKTLAMRAFFKESPPYSIKKMINFARHKSLRDGFRIFKGTVRRILQRRL